MDGHSTTSRLLLDILARREMVMRDCKLVSGSTGEDGKPATPSTSSITTISGSETNDTLRVAHACEALFRLEQDNG